ncbi:hypothetical protein [Emticicia oligotrophica]|uniref:hypothetical protein n=1 Tax=Emticicia oligotrophica TaxID=312279 RepID=UPI00273C3E76|nr:hypothetical protein [Emticicia oligotrophica]
MKKLTLLTCILISTFVRANALEDSLIANIGKKAKVIFYAENKADLNEIAKYDLNKLFAEVRKRSEKNFSNNEEVTLREADDLKNREINTTVSTKKWLKNMNLNLFVGASFTDGYLWSIDEFQEITLPKYGNVNVANSFSLQGNPSFMLGIAGTFDKQVYKRNRMDFTLKYGVGFDLISSRLRTAAGIAIRAINLNQAPIRTLYASITDSLVNARGTDKDVYKNQYSPNITTQFIPTFNVLNKKGQKVLSVGIGLKASVNLAGLGQNSRFFALNNENPNYIYTKHKALQTAIISNIGYKYINLFIQIQPEIGKALYVNRNDDKGLFLDRQGSFSNYVIGLRFGK